MLARSEFPLDQWEETYRTTGAPVAVDFRALVSGAIKPERYTHLLHPYPAKLLPQIPYVFLRSSFAGAGKKKVVADPFCGSGTVLLEALVSDHKAIGADTNPLARLISKVKTTVVDKASINDALSRVNRSAPRFKDPEPPPVVNIHTWYRQDTIHQLAQLRLAIKKVSSRRERDFLLVCLSICARKMSLADPRLSVPVKIKRSRRKAYGPHYKQLRDHLNLLRKVPALDRFNEIVQRNITRIESLRGALSAGNHATIKSNALTLDQDVEPSSVDLIITSPPYVGAQKYIRSSGLSLGWLDLAYEGELRTLERITIGREHFAVEEVRSTHPATLARADQLLTKVERVNPLRAHIARTYLFEMKEALSAMHSILKPGGMAVLVTGPNTIAGFQFDTPTYLEALAKHVGFKTRFALIDHIKSRGLMTKRNKTAGVISSEVVLCMEK